jgi:polysaccharide biosynthesis/export protein
MTVRISLITNLRRSVQRPTLSVIFTCALSFGIASTHLLQAQGPAQSATSTLATGESATPKSSPTPSSSLLPAAADDYVINPEDVLDIYIYDVPELSREYVVSTAGKITVPLLPDPVQAAGLTPDKFSRALEETFRQTGRLSRPQVTVSIKQSRWSVVTVEGAVKTPQLLPLTARTKLLYVLSQCGGLADDHGSTVTITRGALARRDLGLGSGTPALTVELKKVMDANDPTSSLEVWPGDRVTVERAGIFYVLGEVGHPGGYNLRNAQEQVTILEALAIAGDVTSVGKKSKAMIIRKDPSAPSGRNEIALNLKDILAGRSPDQVLQNNDILYVPVSGGKQALRALSLVPQSAIASATTAAVYTRF